MILAATAWRTNAALIADVVELGYIKPADVVLDVTYGRGKWWSLYRHDPDHFLGLIWKYDQQRSVISPDPVMLIEDFADINLPDGKVDVACFDPPYISTGGRTTSTIGDFNERYGLVEAASTPRALHDHNMLGLAECARVARKYVIVKCMDYISSGKLQNVTYWTQCHAEEKLDLHLVEELVHLNNGRVQPPGRRQVHARRNYSTMFIFEKARS